MTARAKSLDPAAPMRSLVDLAIAADVSIAELARRLDVRGPSIHGYIATGDRVQVSTLRAAARALGGELVISYRPAGER